MDSALTRARALAQERRWAELARLVDGVPAEEIGQSPELGYLLADALRRVGQLARSRELAVVAQDGALRLADRRLVLRATNLVGMIDFEAGAMTDAGARFDRLLELACEWDDDEFSARASNNLGVMANVRGDRELALTFYQRALAAYFRLGYARGLAQTYYNIGISYRDLGFSQQAEQNFADAVRYCDVSSSEDVIAMIETERAYLRAIRGDADLAESLAGRALQRAERMEDPIGVANALRVMGVAAEARGEFTVANERFDRVLVALEAHPEPLLRAETQRDRGRVLFALGDTAAAATALTDACDAFTAVGATADLEATRALLSAISGDPPATPLPEA
jgi:tetratricopeptide (TPR) repeat protein